MKKYKRRRKRVKMKLESILYFLPQFVEIPNKRKLQNMLDEKFKELKITTPETHSQNDYLSSYSFLNDDTTINFIKNSKIMFILRGLPGSGKSTLSKAIVNKYPTSTICSADFYFTDKHTGEYKHDVDKLKDAHLTCQMTAKQTCKDSKSPVIIDNTNINFWELKPYVQFANEFHYIVIICEPKTPWKLDLNTLMAKNIHNVPRHVMEQKIKDFKPIIPLYFAWFLNDSDSHLIANKIFDYFDLCLKKCKDFQNELINAHPSAITAKMIFKERQKLLHCTAKYCGKGLNSQLNSNYFKKPQVSKSIGEYFRLRIIGFTITHNTIGAQIQLDNDCVSLWDNDLTELQLNDILSEIGLSSYQAKLTNGSRAHLTIALADKTQAVQTGYDQMKILASLQPDKTNKEIEAFDDFDLYFMRNIGAYLKLKSPMYIDTLFSYGFY